MIAVLAFAVLIVAAVPATGGHFRGIARIRLKHETAILVLFAVQALARGRLFAESSAAQTWSPVWPWCAVVAVLIAVLLANYRVRGVLLVVAGLAANLLVVLLNGRMPVEPGELETGAVIAAVARSGFYGVVSDSTVLPALGDVLRFPAVLGGSPAVYFSAGDVCLLAGVAVILLHAASPEVESSAYST